jgi:hypothetical protein
MVFLHSVTPSFFVFDLRDRSGTDARGDAYIKSLLVGMTGRLEE